MPLDFLIDRFDERPATRALAAGLPGPGSRVPVSGLPGSSPAVLVAALARRLPQRVFVVVTPTPTDAERWLADARALGGDAAALYPQREALGAEEPHVEIAGERRGILDVYGFGMAAPTRVEWSGDEIVSLRPFDLDSQRSGGDGIERVTILPARSEEPISAVGAQQAAPLQRQSLSELLPTDALLVLAGESALQQEVDRAWAEAEHHLEIARRLGEAPPAPPEIAVAPAPRRRAPETS